MRLFLGLSLPGDVRAQLEGVARCAQAAMPGRYVLAENYHITLAFIGCVEEGRVSDAADALRSCVRDFPAPRVRLGALSYFSRPQNAILIARALVEPDIAPLHQRLIDALHARGLPADTGSFAPHITLARHAIWCDAAPVNVPRARFTCPLAHVFLSARDEQNVLRYTPLVDVPFGETGKL